MANGCTLFQAYLHLTPTFPLSFLSINNPILTQQLALLSSKSLASANQWAPFVLFFFWFDRRELADNTIVLDTVLC